jgi:hypothetical protein
MVMTPAEAAIKQAAQAQVEARPARIKGEGFDDYTQRVDVWYAKNNPNATRLEKNAFSSELCDVLTREAMLNANKIAGREVYSAQRVATPASQTYAPKSFVESLEPLNNNYRSLISLETSNKTVSSTSEFLQASYTARRAGHEVKAGGVGMPAETIHGGRLGKAAGIIGIGIGIMAAAGQAAASENRPTTMKDYAKAAYQQTPIAPIVEGKYAEGAVRMAEMVDPTMGVATSGLRTGLRKNGVNVEAGMTESITPLTGEQKRELTHNLRMSGYLAREQNAALQNAGLLDIKGADGKRIDVTAILRDPPQRDAFIKKLEDTAAKATNPNVKESINGMVAAARAFTDVEPQRFAMVERNAQIMASQQATPQTERATMVASVVSPALK